MRLKLSLAAVFLAAGSCCCCCGGDFWSDVARQLDEQGFYIVAPIMGFGEPVAPPSLTWLDEYPGAEMWAALEGPSNDQLVSLAAYSVPEASPEEVLAFYDEEIEGAGWTETDSTTTSGATYELGSARLTVEAEGSGSVTVILNYQTPMDSAP